jgi:hypothetical protein
MASKIDKIFYINLDRRTDRRDLIEMDLAKIGLPAERFVGIPYAVTADIEFEYLCKDLRLKHVNSVSFCLGCGAWQDDGPLNIRNAHPEAPWRGTMVSPEDCALDNGHPLWDAAGLSRFSVVGDWMHSGHLGVLPIVIGGAFEELASGYEGNSAGKLLPCGTMCSESIANSACRSLCTR